MHRDMQIWIMNWNQLKADKRPDEMHVFCRAVIWSRLFTGWWFKTRRMRQWSRGGAGGMRCTPPAVVMNAWGLEVSVGVGSILPHSTIEKDKRAATGGSPVPWVWGLCVCVNNPHFVQGQNVFLLVGKITNAISKKEQHHTIHCFIKKG